MKIFINGFNFPNPSWKDLPNGFPDISNEGLTKEENHLLGGITLAWMATQNQGKLYFLKNNLKTGFFALALLVTLTLSKNFVKSPQWQYIKEVSAATISATLKTTGISENADDLNLLLESTMSGVLRRDAKTDSIDH